MNGITRFGTEVTIMFSQFPVSACVVQLQEPLTRMQLSITANLWCIKKGDFFIRTGTPEMKFMKNLGNCMCI